MKSSARRMSAVVLTVLVGSVLGCASSQATGLTGEPCEPAALDPAPASGGDAPTPVWDGSAHAGALEPLDPASTPVAQQMVGAGMSVNASAGFTVSPETFLFSGEFLFDLGVGLDDMGDPAQGRFGGGLAVGGLLQLGLDDDHVLFAPAAVGRFTFHLPTIPQLRPFGEAGVGFLIDQRVKDRKGRSDRRETNFNGLILFGGGVEWMLTEQLGLGGKGYVNIAPGPGEDFFLSFLGGATWYF